MSQGQRLGDRLPPAVDRKFAAIFAISVIFHATLFAVTAWQRQRTPVNLPPLLASIRLIPAAESGQPAAPAPAGVPPKARQSAPRTERPAPRPVPIAGPANAPAPAVPAATAVAHEPAASAANTPAIVPAGPASPVPAATKPGPVQAEMLAAYRRQLTELFARAPDYPRVAALRGWEGEVRLRLKVARKGNLLDVALDQSSGFDVLDRHALALLEGHGSLPPLPEALEASEIQVVVPINYRLKKMT